MRFLSSVLAASATLSVLFCPPVLASTIDNSSVGLTCLDTRGCNRHPREVPWPIWSIYVKMREMGHDTWIPDGHPTACYDKVCAYLEGTEGAYIQDMRRLVLQLIDLGCR